jgi:hypothetical protein
MKKTSILLIICIICSISINAQKLSTLTPLDDNIRKLKADSQKGIAWINDTHFYIFRSATRKIENGGLFIDKFNKTTGKLEKSQLIPDAVFQYASTSKSKSVEFLAKDANGKPILFYSTADKEKTYLFKQGLDEKTLKLGKAQEIAKIKHRNLKKGRISRQGTFEIYQSPDQSKWMIYSSDKGDDKEPFSTIYTHLLDKDFKSLGESYQDLPYLNLQSGDIVGKELDLTLVKPNIHLSNDGELLILLSVLDKYVVKRESYPLRDFWSDKRFKRKKLNHGDIDYKLYKLGAKNEIQSYTFERKNDYFIYDLDIKLIDDGTIDCIGFFEKEHDYVWYNFEGICHIQINPKDLSIIKDERNLLSEKDKEPILTPLEFSEKSHERIFRFNDGSKNENYFITHRLPQKDNSQILIAEHRMTKDVTTSSDRSPKIYTLFSKILVFRIMENGEIKSIQTVNRLYRELSINNIVASRNISGRGGSFLVHQKGDDLCFIYSTLIGYSSNIERMITTSILKPDGTVETSAITNFTKGTQEYKLLIYPIANYKLNQNSVIMRANNRSKESYIWIKVDFE